MLLVPVLDVEAPPPAPPAPRGRFRSLLLVLVALVMTCSLGVINPAPASAWVGAVVPVVKGVSGIIATTVAGEVVVTKADEAAGDGSAKGKWGKRLKGLPGLAAGLLGGAVGWLGLGDMIDGVKAPQDFQEDVRQQQDEAGAWSGTRRQWTLTEVAWDRPFTSSVGPSFGPRFDADCVTTGSGSNSGLRCPDVVGSPYRVGLLNMVARFECWDHHLGEMYVRNLPVDFNTSGNWSTGGPCSTNGVNANFEPISVELVRAAGQQDYDGLTNPAKFFSPHFDDSALPDPVVSVTAQGTCRSPETGDVVQVSKTVAGVEVIPTVQCPEGTVPESIGWTSNVGGKTEDLGGVGTDWTPFPECAGFKCEKLITIDDVPCRVGVQECFDWQNVNPPSRVKCEYGPYAVGLAECGDLAHIYKSSWGVTQDPAKDAQRQPGWLPSNPDGTVDWTKVGTDWAPEDNPNPEYRPPVRWTPEGPGPTTPPVTAPSNPPFPTTGVNPPISPPGVPPPKNPDAPNENCIASGWSWNPVDWVFVPVKCALTWAFVPKDGPGLIARANDVFDGTGMGDWLGIVPAWIDALPDAGTACMGPPLVMPASMGGETYYPLNACSDPMAKYAQMSRAVMTVVVSFAGVISIVNSVTLAFTGYRAFEREGLAIQAAAVKDAERTKST